MRRTLVLLPVLLVGLAPAAVAQEGGCGGSHQEVPTLSLALAPAPATVQAGRTVAVPLSVQRAGTPAGGVSIHLRLRYGPGRDDVTLVGGETGADGRALLGAALPATASGPLRLTVYASKSVVGIPCYGTVEEYGTTAAGWGRAVR